MDYRQLAEEAAERALASPDTESKFYALGQRDAYGTVANFGDAEHQVAFLRSCVESADQERDHYREELAAWKALIIERAGEDVFNAWSRQIAAQRREAMGAS